MCKQSPHWSSGGVHFRSATVTTLYGLQSTVKSKLDIQLHLVYLSLKRPKWFLSTYLHTIVKLKAYFIH